MHISKLFKFIFIFIAIGLTIFLLTQKSEQAELALSQIDPVNTQLENTKVSDVASTIMQAPRFSGEDNKNRKWLITAKQAKQSGTVGSEEVMLDTIQANLTTSKGKKLSFSAIEGIYKHTDEALTLQKDIYIEGYGFIIKTEQITALLKQGIVKGDKIVNVKTDQGKLVAQAFNIEDNGSKITFSGGVHGIFKLKDTK